ncbi:MAG: imidazoleglycerol-phosphate dehydratase HisB [Clostridiales bacterium]|jgi:imidazoleglycerol-phosphate dehydratase|nr:imidazoleglycerol-phosphate dehydratase HisB [Clostridiales bacterium]
MRECELKRKTKETEIELKLSLDGKFSNSISTGIGFFNHMLNSFAVHSGFGLELKCKGDLEVDSHHTVEDVGIVLGTALNKLTENKVGLARFGNFTVPMDESLATCSVDISGRPYLAFNAEFSNERVGDLDTQMVKEFFYAFAMNARLTLHINLLYGSNDHHKIEAIFKAFAHALKNAVIIKDEKNILSTKGSL